MSASLIASSALAVSYVRLYCLFSILELNLKIGCQIYAQHRVEENEYFSHCSRM